MNEQENLIVSDPHDQLNEIINALNLDKVNFSFISFLLNNIQKYFLMNTTKRTVFNQ